MARIRKPEKGRAAARELSVSHRERLVEELRADPALAAEYLNAAAEDGDPRVYLTALRTVAEAQGMAKVAVPGAFRRRESAIFYASRDTESRGAEDGGATNVGAGRSGS